MAAFTGTITPISSGTLTIPAGFTPAIIEVLVGPRFSTVEVSPRRSEGWATATRQYCHALYFGSPNNRQQAFNDRIVSQWENVSGTLTEVLRVDFSSFSGTNALLNVVTPNSNYQLYVRVLD